MMNCTAQKYLNTDNDFQNIITIHWPAESGLSALSGIDFM